MLRPPGATRLNQYTNEVQRYPSYVYTQIMASLYNLEPRQDVKAAINENTHPRPTPRNIRLYQGINFPADGIKFRSTLNHRGKEWLDFGWVRVEEDSLGAEPDYWTEDPQKTKRQLVRFWLFGEVEGVKYAFVDVYRKYRPRRDERKLWDHPILQRYQHVPFVSRRGGNVTELPPFFAVPVSAIVGAACVFPDLDQGREFGDHSVGERVLYHPPLVELCGYTDWKFPNDSVIPEPPAEDLADVDLSSEGSDGSVDGDEESEEEEELSIASGSDSEEDMEDSD